MTDTNDKTTNATASGITSEVAELEAVSVDLNTGNAPPVDEPTGEPEGKAPEQDTEGGDKEEGQQDAAPELPEYDPENEEVRTQYEERYFPEGTFNKDLVSKEFWKSFEANEGDLAKSGLSEGTYAFLQDMWGMDRTTIKQMEASLVALHREEASKTFAKVGGQEAVTKALDWAKQGGYTKEQQDRFNAAMDAGGEARDEALELLVNRFGKVNPPAQTEERRRGPRGRFSSSPERDATARATSGAPKPDDVFKDTAEHSSTWQKGWEKMSEAKASRDPKAIDEAQKHLDYISRKARRSPALKQA